MWTVHFTFLNGSGEINRRQFLDRKNLEPMYYATEREAFLSCVVLNRRYTRKGLDYIFYPVYESDEN